jgi:NADPH:quinone reductase-like Zn-dependent oxidoreductase
MRAVTLTIEGQPAAFIDQPDPQPPADGAVIELRASSVNGFDVFQVGGGLMGMMPHALPTIVGRDLAGIVRAVGADRTDVAVGDEVLGFITSDVPLHDGTWAELVVGGANLILAPKPAGLDWGAAAAIPLAASTALDSVDAVDPKPGDTVLVIGATGGVGSFAVQFAAARGARVLASARPGEETDLVLGLGAAEAIDYTVPDLADAIRRLAPDGVASLIDTVNRGEAFAPLAALVRDGGRASTTLGAADEAALAERGIIATNVRGTPTTEKLARLAGLADDGTLQVPIQATFALEDYAKAVEAFTTGTRGKLVLTVG